MKKDSERERERKTVSEIERQNEKNLVCFRVRMEQMKRAS